MLLNPKEINLTPPLIFSAVKSMLLDLTSKLEIVRCKITSNVQLALELIPVKKLLRIAISAVLALSLQLQINSPVFAKISTFVRSKESLQTCTLPWAQTGMNLSDGKVAGISFSKYPGSTVSISKFLIKDKPNVIDYPTLTAKVKVSDLLACGIDLNSPNATGNFVAKVIIQKWDKLGNLINTMTLNVFLASFQANVTTENGIDYLNLNIDTTSYFPAAFNQRRYSYYAVVENIQQGKYIPNPWSTNPPYLTDYSTMVNMPNTAFLNNGLVVQYWLAVTQNFPNTMKGAPSSWDSVTSQLSSNFKEYLFGDLTNSEK